jgi:opacity protein-like surface antigen
MKRFLKSTLILFGLTLVFSTAAYAQLSEDLEVNVFGAGTWYASKNYQISFPQSPTPMPERFTLSNAIGGGVRVNVNTHGHWGEEFFYSWEPNTAHFKQLTTPSKSLNLNLYAQNIGVNAIYYLSDDETHRIRPFLSVGTGWAVYQLTGEAKQIAVDPLQGNVPDIDNANEWAFNYGAGFKTKLASWVGIRVDVRGFISRNPSFGLPRSSNNANATVFPAGGAMNSGEASAGFVFYFGKR